MADKKISEMTAATSLAGTELIPIVQSGANKTTTPSMVQSYLKKEYTAYISQTSTNAPTVDVALLNTLGGGVWSYSAVGTYLFTLAGAFSTANKTVPNLVTPFMDAAGNLITLERTSANVLTLKTYAAVDTTVLANGVITGQYIHFEVYN